MFYLSTLSYAQNADPEISGTLLAFATVPELCPFTPPQGNSFELSYGYGPDRFILEYLVRDNVNAISLCPESPLPRRQYETVGDAQQRQKDAYESSVETNVTGLVNAMVAHWSNAARLDQDYIDFHLYIATAELNEQAQHLFDSWYRNSAFREYVSKLQAVLDKLEVAALTIQSNSFEEPSYSYRSRNGFVEMDSLFRKAPPRLSLLHVETFKGWTRVEKHRREDYSNLAKLLNELKSSLV